MKKLLCILFLSLAVNSVVMACVDEGLSARKMILNCFDLAEKGNAEAQLTLGIFYNLGLPPYISKSDKEAIKWYTQSAEQGNVSAQSHLGLMYDVRRGFTHNYVLAYMYFSIAGANGDKASIRRKDLTLKKMTPAQIEEAQRLTQKWMDTH